MSLHEYRFRSTWLLPAPAELVFGALADVAGYPRWWPDVRSVLRVDDDTADVVCRTLVPYSIVVRMRRMEQDPARGRLGVLLSGDLEGVLRGRVRQHGAATRLEITQDVEAHKRLIRCLSPVARPVFRFNHAVMMRRGERGLRTHLVP